MVNNMHNYDLLEYLEYNKSTKEKKNNIQKCRWSKDVFSYNYQIIKEMLSEIKKSKIKILDAGCGTGEYSSLLSKKASHLTCIDYIPEMIKISRKKAKGNNIAFICDNLLNLKYKNNIFNLVIALGVIQSTIHVREMLNMLSNWTKEYLIISFLSSRYNVDLFKLDIKKSIKSDQMPHSVHTFKLLDILKILKNNFKHFKIKTKKFGKISQNIIFASK